MKFTLYQKLKEILYLQNFGSNPDAYKFLDVNGHIGIDVNFGHLDEIKSGYKGTIVYVKNDSIVILTDTDVEGNCLEITYSHGQDFRFNVGDKVNAGDVLCLQNSSGPTIRREEDWSHLHLGIRLAISVAPENYINQNLKWNFAYFSPIKYHILNIKNGFDGFINPNNYCEQVIYKIAKAIERKENAPKKWNNPGAIKRLSGGFMTFTTYQAGFDYLVYYLERAATGKHRAYNNNMSVYDFFKTYSPKTDGNDPLKYAQDVVNWVGLRSIHDKISDWLLTEFDWAKKYNNAEFMIYPVPPVKGREEETEKLNYITFLFKKLWSLIFQDKK